jgi:hypothetical protein
MEGRHKPPFFIVPTDSRGGRILIAAPPARIGESRRSDLTETQKLGFALTSRLLRTPKKPGRHLEAFKPPSTSGGSLTKIDSFCESLGPNQLERNMQAVLLYDPHRVPSDWVRSLRPGQFAVFLLDVTTLAMLDQQGVPVTNQAAETCLVFDRLVEAKDFCQQLPDCPTRSRHSARRCCYLCSSPIRDFAPASA